MLYLHPLSDAQQLINIGEALIMKGVLQSIFYTDSKAVSKGH